MIISCANIADDFVEMNTLGTLVDLITLWCGRTLLSLFALGKAVNHWWWWYLGGNIWREGESLVYFEVARDEVQFGMGEI